MSKPGLRQAVEQDATVLLVAVLDRLHLGAPVERRLGGDLRQRRHRDREIACCSRSIGRTSGSGTTIQPMRQPVMQKYFENELMITASSDNRAAVSAGKRIVEAVIDLVGDEADALAVGGARSDRAAPARVIMVPVGLAGTCDQHALERRLAMRAPAASRR